MSKHLDKTQWGWWKSAVFYQIYPKSFQDTTGSGTGDLRGLSADTGHRRNLDVSGLRLPSGGQWL